MAVRKKKAKTARLLKDLKAVAVWVAEQGYKVSMRTVYNHSEGAAFPSPQKGGGYLVEQIEAYANATWENPQKIAERFAVKPGTSPDALDSKARILAADAAMREHKLAVAQGLYYLKSEEDQRDALVLYGIKTAMLNSGPFIIQDLIAMVGTELGADAAAKINQIIPELRERFSNSVLDMFDGMAKAGGVETPDTLPRFKM